MRPINSLTFSLFNSNNIERDMARTSQQYTIKWDTPSTPKVSLYGMFIYCWTEDVSVLGWSQLNNDCTVYSPIHIQVGTKVQRFTSK